MRLSINLLALAVAAAVVGLIGQSSAYAASASTTMTYTQLGPGSYQYTIDLTNTDASSPIGTFWFSWVPFGYNFMPTAPTVVASPSGWFAPSEHLGAGDGYSIEWYTLSSSSAIQPGHSFNFMFDSATTPQQMAADSTLYPGFPVLTSVLYSGAPFSDAGSQFLVAIPTAAAVPEPASLGAVAIGLLACVRRRVTRALHARVS